MTTIQIHDLRFELFIPHVQIIDRIQEMARLAEQDYANDVPLLIAVMDGAVHFASSFSLAFSPLSEIHFVKASSYIGTRSAGAVAIAELSHIPFSNRKVLILEDIIESGKTISELIKKIQDFGPNEIQVACLFRKQSEITFQFPIHYVGFDIGKEFIVGFGLDYDGLGRSLKDVYIKTEN